jgi:hypothetical protein
VTEEEWINEANRIALEFVQDDDDLGLMMLDQADSYWFESYDEGLTPQQALDRLIKILKGEQ